MDEVLYHGGNLDVPCDTGAMGLWATDDLDAARDYAASCAYQNPDGVAYVYRIRVEGDVVPLRDAVPAEVADRVEAGVPSALAYSGYGPDLIERGVAAVWVESGDEHPDTGREHKSWWIPGVFTSEVLERVDD